jgi:Na+-transporting NADH:ubiquinone oxidoreductase subunit C
MNTTSNGYVLGFAVLVCVVISAGLAATSTALKQTQDEAREFDRQKNVMVAAGLIQEGDARPAGELKALYAERVTEQVLDTETGKVLTDKATADVAKMNKEAVEAAAAAKKAASSQSLTAEQETEQKAKTKKAATRYRAIAVAKTDAGSVYVLPISGKGLWSTLFGYLALEGDANTVRGITFYQHGETPGLGGEVDNPQWKANWRGKTVRDEQGKLVGVVVKKGKVDPSIPAEKHHYVDGLSGATITSNGVTRFVKADLETFESYLSQFRKQ